MAIIKIAKNKRKATLETHYSPSMKKTARENAQNLTNEKYWKLISVGLKLELRKDGEKETNYGCPMQKNESKELFEQKDKFKKTAKPEHSTKAIVWKMAIAGIKSNYSKTWKK